MSDLGTSVMIAAPADEVFHFVSEPANMAQYLPTASSARRQGDDLIEVEGEAHGKPYDSTGWFDLDRSHLMMRWGSNGDNHYAGHLTVTAMSPETCKAELRLMFAHSARTNMQNSLDDTMGAIKRICEEQHGPVAEEPKPGKRGYVY